MSADVVFGIIVSIISIYCISVASKLPAGTSNHVPGAGYFPIILASILILLSIAMIIRGLKNKTEYFDLKQWGKENVQMFLLTIAIIIVSLLLWRFTVYIVACLFMSFSLSLVYKLGWKKGAILSVIFSFSTYFVFNNALHVVLTLR